MKIDIKAFLIFLILSTFLFINIVKANAIWPAMEHKMSNFYIIICGFIIEALFIKFCAKQKIFKAFYISAIMNMASFFIGAAFITTGVLIFLLYIILRLLSFVSFGLYDLLAKQYTDLSNIIFMIIFYIAAVSINVLIEGYVVDIIFWIDFKKSLWWLILSNLISVILCFCNSGLLNYYSETLFK